MSFINRNGLPADAGSVRKWRTYFPAIVITVASIGIVFWLIVKIGNVPDQKQNKSDVLAINSNKSVYLPNEEVKFGMASLNSEGNTLCDSNLKIVVTAPSGKETILSTQEKQIVVSSTCSTDNNVTNDPDYTASFSPTEEGTYKLKLINNDTGNESTSGFNVESTHKYSLERNGATRINPFKSQRYPMMITVTATEAFTGQVVEQIPEEFEVVWQGPAKVENTKGYKTITWDVNLAQGESKELGYSYKAPTVSPKSYFFGEAKILQNGQEIFRENRVWQTIRGDVE